MGGSIRAIKPAAAAEPAGSGSSSGSMAILRRDGPRVVVTDYDTAIFVYHHDVPLVSAVEVARNQTHFTFYDPENEKRVEKLAVDFCNNEMSSYASAGHRLKRVIVRLPRDRRT